MKKRIWILLLALALLLTACGPGPGPESGSSDAAATAEPTKTEPATTEPALTEPSGTEPVPSYTASGSRTAGGVLVHTDPSAYRPDRSPAALYTRLREGPLDCFEPSEDYGAVYPYAAARRYSSGEEGYSWEAGEYYGLVDASGRILTDGIYLGVRALTKDAYEFGNDSYLPFWVLSSLDSAEVVTESYGEESYSWIEGEVRYGLVSMDGSFMLPIEYCGITVLGDGFRCSREWDGVSYEVYDGSGRLLFTGAELIGDDDFTGVTAVEGGEGLFLIELYSDERPTQCWFCNSRGERLLGPYAEADAFHDGLACVSQDGKRYGYVDTAGTWILEPRFTDLGSFQDGRAIQRLKDGSTVIIDTAGNVLLELGADRWVYRVPCGFRADGENNDVRYYDRDGGFLLSGDSWMENLDEDTFWENDFDDEGRIFRLNGPALELSGVYALSPGRTVLDGKAVEGYLCYAYVENDNTGHPCFIPQDLSAVYRLDLHGQPRPDTYNTSFTAVDQCTNEAWELIWNGEAWDAVNEAGEIRTIPLRVNCPVLRGDRIMALTDRACVYVDWDGKLLFSYPLDGGD